MSLNCGIVGLPNVGKSTIFSALTAAPAEAANYPFCTIDPNIGLVSVPDERLERIHEIIPAEKKVPAIVEFVDIAGLVKGASKGEGRGNQFLANIREVSLIIHVVRCFDNPDIIHVNNKIDPVGDMETINIELALADLASLEKKLPKTEKNLRSPDKTIKLQAEKTIVLLKKLQDQLGQGIQARALSLSAEEIELISDCQLLTLKKQIYVCNVDETGLSEDSVYVRQVKEIAAKEETEAVVLCGKLESDIAALETDEDRKLFLEEAGLKESGLSRLAKTAYKALGLRTFFTVGGKENRAWTFVEGASAPQAAGTIHTDFEKGFIKAEVYHCEDLFRDGTEQKIRAAGKMRIEGKNYSVQDGDIMFFKFNV
jgi:GTP-binding protein YchF